MMENWVSKVGDYAACFVISPSMVYRWDSRCSRLRKHRLASRYARTASSRTAQQDRQIMRQSGECCLPRHTRPINGHYVAAGLFHWVWSLHQHRDRHWSIILLCLRRAKRSSISTQTNHSRSMRIRTASVSCFLAVRRPHSLFLVYRPGIIHSDPPRSYRE